MADVVESASGIGLRIAAEYAKGGPGVRLAKEIADAILAERARLSQAGAGGVVVKPLRWRRRRRGSDDFYVETDVGEYCVGLVHSSYAAIRRSIRDAQLHDEVLHRGLGLEEAKAICQADYEARIRSALAASPSAGEPVAWQLQFDDGAWSPALYNEHDAKAALAKVRGGVVAAIRPLYATPPAPPIPASVEAVAAFLKERDESLLAGEADDAERTASAQEILRLASLTAPTQGDRA